MTCDHMINDGLNLAWFIGKDAEDNLVLKISDVCCKRCGARFRFTGEQYVPDDHFSIVFRVEAEHTH